MYIVLPSSGSYLLGLLLWCHLQDSGRGFQALGSVQNAAHA